MIKALSFNKKTNKVSKIKIGDVEKSLASGTEVAWLDLVSPTEAEYKELKKIFNFHQLTIEDTKDEAHLPKIDEYEDHLFLVWHALNDNPQTPKIEHTQVSIFLGKNYLVTIHQKDLPVIDRIFNKCCNNHLFTTQGADWLLHLILDDFVDDYFPLIDGISSAIDEIEDRIFSVADKQQMRKLFVLKHKLVGIKKVVVPQRDIISSLARFENKLISADHMMYFRDIFDHLIRVLDLVDSSRDAVSGIMDIYLSSISNKMNEVMTRLTIVATIFLPLTLLTGIYGMNFRFMPELNWRYWYFVVWAFILTFGLGSYLYYKKKLNW